MSENLSLIPEASAAQPDSMIKCLSEVFAVAAGCALTALVSGDTVHIITKSVVEEADTGRGLCRQCPQLPLYRCCCALAVTDKVLGHLRLLENTQDTKIDGMLSVFNLQLALAAAPREHWDDGSVG